MSNLNSNLSFRTTATVAALALLAGVGNGIAAQAQEMRVEQIEKTLSATLIPNTTFVRDEDRGVRAHTNHIVRLLPETAGMDKPTAMTAAAAATVAYTVPQTPQMLRGIYNLPTMGGSGTIAIVGAFDYATALNDFNVYSQKYGLPTETSKTVTVATNKVFQVVYATGTKPVANAGWGQEMALDIECAHAMAPNAKIVLVEASTDDFNNLINAVTVAGNQLNVHEVSMSWGGAEFKGETSYDNYFTKAGVVYVAATGDTGGLVEYPAVSPNVIAAGGTSVHRNAAGAYTGETGWAGAGGGISAYEARPGFQAAVANTVGKMRGIPDLAFEADPLSGVMFYDSTPNGGFSGWMSCGGTSIAAPSIAAILNDAGTVRGWFSANTASEATTLYTNMGNFNSYRDIVAGSNGPQNAHIGWDGVTGIGSCLGLSGK